MNPIPCLLQRLSAIAAAALLSGAAQAGNFSVTPVRIFMKPTDRAIAVTIQNEGDTPVALQTDLYTWAQKPDGTDDLVLTQDLIVAPPIIKLAPKARQVVRLARLTPADQSRQLTYRLIVREVPEVTEAKPNGNIVLQLPIALAMSMPVFITPQVAQRNVQCQVARMDSTSLNALCQNSGTAYAQVRQIVLSRGEQQLAKFEGGAYILPGARRSMSLKAEKAVEPGAAIARVTFDDGKTTELNVQLQ